MADDNTQTLGNGSSFEDRVFARLDAMERSFNERFTGIDARLAALEAQAEERAKETRPIWEKALAEILATREEVKALHTKLDILNDDVLNVRARQRESDMRLKEFEALLHRG